MRTLPLLSLSPTLHSVIVFNGQVLLLSLCQLTSSFHLVFFSFPSFPRAWHTRGVPRLDQEMARSKPRLLRVFLRADSGSLRAEARRAGCDCWHIETVGHVGPILHCLRCSYTRLSQQPKITVNIPRCSLRKEMLSADITITYHSLNVYTSTNTKRKGRTACQDVGKWKVHERHVPPPLVLNSLKMWKKKIKIKNAL